MPNQATEVTEVTEATQAAVRVATTIPAFVHTECLAMCASSGIDFNTATRMALMHSLALHRQGLAPFGLLPIASYSNGRQALSDSVRLGLSPQAFHVFYANSETSKRVSIANHMKFLDDGAEAGWMYRDGSTNQKLCLRLMWALEQLQQKGFIPGTGTEKPEPTEWMKLAHQAAQLYP